METIARLTDTDAEALEERVGKTLARSGAACEVSYFTYWYTGRLPVHEALISRRT